MMHRLKCLWVTANLTIIVFCFGLFGFWYFVDGSSLYPFLTSYADEMNLKTDSTTYRVGDVVYVYNSFCKYRNVPVTVDAILVDGERKGMTPLMKQVPIGCYGIDKPYSTELLEIPKGIAKGTWHVEYTVHAQLNPIKTLDFTRQTVSFEII